MNTRLSIFRRKLSDRGIDAAIVTGEKNIAYLCGYFYDDGYLWIDAKNAFLITDFRYTEEAEKFAKNFEVVTPAKRLDFLNDIIQNDKVATVGYESANLSVAAFRTFEAGLAVTFLPISDILDEMRTVKSEDEIAAIKHAQGIAERAFAHILDRMHPNMKETDIALELAYFMQKNGAWKTSFDTIVASGAASALPHAKCRNVKISGGFLTMDFGCVYNGYCSDMTRTVVIGKADAEMKKLYETVLDAQRAALEYIRAGVICADVDLVARRLIDGRGYEGAFSHSLGHGVGLDIHELPRLSPSATDQRLVAGHVVTVEPGIYLKGKYGCRIEDMGCVTEDGFDNFTSAAKEMIELFA